jgi:molybdopterin converting factor small subunit
MLRQEKLDPRFRGGDEGSVKTRILFFGRLAEQIGRDREMDIPDEGCAIGVLRRRLAEDPDLQSLAPGGGMLASVDQQIVQDDARVMPGQEIAFFSPLSGG